MIVLTEIAEKLSKILNYESENNYQYMVATQGFHFDQVFDMKTGKNFIPVFVSTMGGTIQPIPNLEMGNYEVPIIMYFPVRFKDDFFHLGEFLARTFVGKVIDYGVHSGKCLSNISPTRFGEIQEIDLQQFSKWVENCYKIAFPITEEWMSMEFTLYLSSAKGLGTADGVLFGNDATITLSYMDNGSELIENAPIFVRTSVGSNGEPNAQQVLGEKETAGLVMNTSYSVPLEIYVKDNEFYGVLIGKYLNGEIQNMPIKLKIDIPSTIYPMTYERECFISNASLNMAKGELITFAMTLSKKVDLNG